MKLLYTHKKLLGSIERPELRTIAKPIGSTGTMPVLNAALLTTSTLCMRTAGPKLNDFWGLKYCVRKC